ncbi:MAG: M20 family metallo-hydrolase [Candidatus Micrarchaeia archaeon]
MEINKLVDSYKDEMIDTMKRMIAIPAISPLSGGTGEGKRADMLEHFLKKSGFETKRYDYKDNMGAKRSNIIATMPNRSKHKIWILSHIDTVSEGDRSLWNHDPFDAYVKEGKLFGRGTSDNGQGVISSIFALKALMESHSDPKYSPAIALVADEEVGSDYGVKKLLNENIFKNNDMFVVPDWGNEKGDEIEVAEKGILWLKFTVIGKQVHASTPESGINAGRIGAELVVRLGGLGKRFNASDKLFSPNTSTFEPTKHEKNVESINIIPGKEVFYFDCRVLPKYKLGGVLSYANNVAKRLSKESGAKIKIEVFNREDPAKPTSNKAEIVKLLTSSIYKVKGIRPKAVGIGGGTVAKYLRDRGMQSVVWATLPDNAHQPNEYLVINDMVADAKVFANMFL